MKTLKTALKGIATAAAISLSAAPANAAVIELALALDGSGSIGPSDFNLQKQAYQNIFASGTFYDDYVIGGDDLWVATWQFATNVQQEQDWFLINDNVSAAAFGNTFASIVQTGGWTNTASATVVATDSILNNGIDSDRAVIDVSTDGEPTRCFPDCGNYSNSPSGAINAAKDAAAYASNNGVVVNAIGVGNALNKASGVAFLESYTNIGGGFYELATDFSAFQSALEDKLFREINDMPPASVSEPGTLALFAIGLAGLAATRRKKA